MWKAEARKMTETHARMLPDGKRLHLQAGPIDIIIHADGEPSEVALAFKQASDAFEPILQNLSTELAALRTPVEPGQQYLQGLVARIMEDAALEFAEYQVTPLIAVAGSIAEYVLARMLSGRTLDRVYVNNGGDIAFYLAEDQSYDIGIVDQIDNPTISQKASITASDPIAGVATSGWQGRSFSLGAADAVTVLAINAPMADAAATLIANEVDPGDCQQIERMPAIDLNPDSDLGDRLVTTLVHPLTPAQKTNALDRGARLAQKLIADGLIKAVAMSVQGMVRLVGCEDIKMISDNNSGEEQHAGG
jgi:uncharacterized protein